MSMMMIMINGDYGDGDGDDGHEDGSENTDEGVR